MHVNDLVGWFFSCLQLVHPKIDVLSPTQWDGQTIGKACNWNSEGVRSSGLREVVPEAWLRQEFSSFCMPLPGNFSLTQLGN